MEPLTGLVLCGGASQRMGRDKALLEHRGTTLLAGLTARLARECDPVILASGEAPRFSSLGLEEVADPVPSAGPLGGLVAGLRASPHRLVAVVAVDMPRANPGLLRHLAEMVGNRYAAVPSSADGIEPAHAVYSTDALAEAEAGLLSERRSLHSLLARIPVLVLSPGEVAAAGFDRSFAANVNTPLEALGQLSSEP